MLGAITLQVVAPAPSRTPEEQKEVAATPVAAAEAESLAYLRQWVELEEARLGVARTPPKSGARPSASATSGAWLAMLGSDLRFQGALAALSAGADTREVLALFDNPPLPSTECIRASSCGLLKYQRGPAISMQNGKQESFFSNKMENFLSDARKEEQERRRVAMEEAVRQAKLGTAARNASPEAPPVRSPVRSVTGGNSLALHPAVSKAENILASHTHTMQIHIPKVAAMPVATEAAISKHPGQMQRVAMVPASQVLVEPARLTTTGLTSELRPHDLLKVLNPKPEPFHIEIEAQEQSLLLARRSCCFWDCQGEGLQ
ncbi:hypothetical protein AK812_SmicGene32282 [Symbiodinium microadriaticum]|uniref:Uncharacterized protein n=1 Tax=Symbiodinium microadriaticum TaxID=2951 RepID=A0A1Q9CUL9_SYMMI|nr:hypothetical protein AK812_SmicGene32282 [Symbiodinium microadriaticum]